MKEWIAEANENRIVIKKELIRCKDCKYNQNNATLYADDDPIESYIHCGHLGDEGHCSLAKRKDE